MKPQVPSVQGLALCERCFNSLLLEVKQHKSFVRKTFSGNESTWTRGQVRHLAQVLGIDLERFKKGHKVHIIQAKENTQADGDLSDNVDMPAQDLPSASRDTAALFGEKFIALMEKRPDINKSIMEVLRTKLGTTSTLPSPKPTQPSPQFPYITTTSIQVPLSPPVALPLNYQSIPNTPHINSIHNFNYNYFAGSGLNNALSEAPTMCIHPAHPQAPHSPSTSSTIQVNINFNMPSTSPQTLATSAFLSEINDAVVTSLHRHSTLLTRSQIPPRVSNGGILARCSNQQ